MEHLSAVGPGGWSTASACPDEGGAAILVDCTVGLGGHARLLLERNPSLRLLGLDADEANLAVAGDRLAEFGDRVRLVKANFSDFGAVLERYGVKKAVGVLADLGLSSNQILDPARGFSFDADGPLDMRIDRSSPLTASDLLNTLSEGELSDLLYLQSQERHSRRIARRICQARRQGRLNSTVVLARLVASASGENPDSRRCRIHPATRTFMALRMAVNGEIDSLHRLLDAVPSRLAVGGRVAVISFHSVEDRVVKEDFRRRNRAGEYRIVTKKPVAASDDERRANPRGRSAKLRVAERVVSAAVSPQEERPVTQGGESGGYGGWREGNPAAGG